MQLKRIKTGLIVLLAGTAVYTLAGFLLAPYAIKHWIERSIATEPGFELRVRHVYLNPFSLSLSLSDLSLIDRDNRPVVSICRAETRLWTLEKLRAGQRGREVEIGSLRVVDPSAGVEILTVPRLSARGLVVAPADGTVTMAAAFLDEPALNITRDAAGRLRLPAWLPTPANDTWATRIRIDEIEIAAGRLRFTDHAQSPTLRFDADGIAGNITHVRAAEDASTYVELNGRIGKSGDAGMTAQWRPSARSAQTEIDLSLRQFEFPLLSPYFARIAGRGIAAGTGDLSLRYRHRGRNVRIDNRIDVTGLTLGNHAETDRDETLPLELVLALVTDQAGRIDVSIPVKYDATTDGMGTAGIVTQNLADNLSDQFVDYISDVASRPFDVLSELVGQTDQQFSSLPFAPGSAEITPVTADRLTLLARALGQRPLLGLRVYPAFDPLADRNALAEAQVRLHIRLATSAEQRGLAADVPLDFDDPRVRAVLNEFAGERLGESDRASGPAEGDAAYYRAIYDALAANEDVSDLALNRLARFRARSIVDAFAGHGIGEARILLGDDIETRTGESEPVLLRLEALRYGANDFR